MKTETYRDQREPSIPVPRPLGSQGSRPAPSRTSSAPRPAPTRPRYVLAAVVVVATVGLAAAWSLITQRELERSRIEDEAAQLDRVRASFDASRARTQASLQALCRVMSEDPRLKSTLATAGMDAATVDDILADLSVSRGHGFFIVLSPAGRVFAEAGAKELRGLDLSASSIVKRAQSEPGAAVGTWALGTQVMDLSIMALRYGEDLIGYLVVGESVGDAEMAALSRQCDCEVATALGTAVAAASTKSGELGAMFGQMAGQPGVWRGRVLEAKGTRYVSNVFELGDVTQSHRLMLARAHAGGGGTPSTRVGWLLWFPPALVLLAVLIAFMANRSSKRSS